MHNDCHRENTQDWQPGSKRVHYKLDMSIVHNEVVVPCGHAITIDLMVSVLVVVIMIYCFSVWPYNMTGHLAKGSLGTLLIRSVF